MTFHPMGIPGAWRIALSRAADERGWFARTFCACEFAVRGLRLPVVQASLSFNKSRATLRGLHWQAPPHCEAKLVRCLQGRIWDVLVDLRPGSPHRGLWEAVELDSFAGEAVYVPEGVAHGFLTLEDATTVLYQVSAPYRPASARGVRWDDPVLAIRWPLTPQVISARDRCWPGWDSLSVLVQGELHALSC